MAEHKGAVLWPEAKLVEAKQLGAEEPGAKKLRVERKG